MPLTSAIGSLSSSLGGFQILGVGILPGIPGEILGFPSNIQGDLCIAGELLSLAGSDSAFLVSSNPANNSFGSSATVPVVFQIAPKTHRYLGISIPSLTVYLDGQLAILDGAFQTGFAGTLVPTTPPYNANNINGGLIVTISTHPTFSHPRVPVVIYAECGDG